jgi:capsid protein
MRIPILSSFRETRQAERKAHIDYLKAETSLINERSFAIQEMNKQRKEAVTAIMSKIEKPTMTMNSELYGSTSTYSSDLWNKNFAAARRVSRIAHAQGVPAQTLTGRFQDLVYGTHLELQALPFFDLIPNAPKVLPEDNENKKKETVLKQQAIINNIERRWWLWGKSKYSDYDNDKNYFKRSRDEFEDLLIDGEYFLLLRYSQSRKRNPLTIQTIKPENIMRSGSDVAQGNKEIDGIEYQGSRAVAYHVYDPDAGKSVRVPRYGMKSGRTFVIHCKIGKGKRGVGILAGIITELTKLSDFTALEIQAAVINALFAIWVETPIGGEKKTVINKRGISGIQTTSEQRRQSVPFSEYEAKLNSTDFDHGGIIVQELGEGQKLNSFDTKRPIPEFDNFCKAVKRGLYASRGMSLAVAEYDFNGQYAAARGELLVLWERVKILRFDEINDRHDIIYQMWLWGEIDNGFIPNFGFDDETIRDAFSNAEWKGPARPDIDPWKTAQSNKVKVMEGWETNQNISAEYGSDFDENIDRLAIENIRKAEANEPIIRLEKTSYSESVSKTESVSKVEE